MHIVTKSLFPVLLPSYTAHHTFVKSTRTVTITGVVDPGYDVMPNPYTMYSNPAYQSSCAPTNGVGATGNGYQINNAPTDYAPQTTLLNNSRAPTHAPPVNDMGMVRVPPPSPLPDTFGDNDIYGRATRLEEYTGSMNVPKALRVRDHLNFFTWLHSELPSFFQVANE